MQRLFAGVVAALAAVVCGCGGGGSPSTPTPTPGGGGQTPVTITIVGQNGSRSFSPNPASAGGQLVVFRNTDSVVHRVRLNDDTIDTGDISPGGTSRAVQMPAAGTNYHCSVHPDMIGAINAASGGGPPTCEGPYCEG